MAPSEREYWIASGREEIKSLKDLKVFVLVPRSDLPRGQQPLWGCQGPSHGGSYMAKGTSHIRIGLPPRIVLGDRLASVSCFLDCLLFTCV